ELLPEFIGQLWRDQAGEDVGDTTCGPGDDDAHRPRRPFLRMRRWHERGRCNDQREYGGNPELEHAFPLLRLRDCLPNATVAASAQPARASRPPSTTSVCPVT